MALKVGELYATMRMDSKQFDKALQESGKRFESLGSVIGKGTRAAAQVFAATTTAALALGAAALKVGLDYNRMQQNSRAALLSLLGSTEAVNAQMAKLDEFASTSPFSKQVFIQAQQQMLAFGIEAKNVIPYLDAIQNAVAAAGGSSQDILQIADVLSKVQSQGKITARELNQLGAAGIDAATLIGNSMGKTAEEIRTDITAGALDAGTALDALAEGMSERFAGATANLKQQMDGAVDRVKAAWRDIGSIMATPLIDPGGGGKLVEWTNLFADGLRQVQKHAGPVTDLLWGRMGPGIDMITAALKRANAAIAGWNTRSLEDSLAKLGQYTPVVSALGASFFALGTNNLPILRTFGITGINPLVAGVAALVATSPELRQVGASFLEAVKPAIEPAKELSGILGGFLMDSLNRLTPALEALLVAAAELGVDLLSSLVPAVQALVNISTPLVDAVASLAEGFAGLPKPVQLAVVAFAAMKALKLGSVFAELGKAGVGALKSFGGAAETAALQVMYLRDGGGGLSAAFAPLASTISKVGTALKTAFISNAPLLAITALVTVLAHFAKKAEEARERAKAYADSLDEVTGAATDFSKQKLVDILMEQADTFEKAGISMGQVADEAGRGVDVFEKYADAIYAADLGVFRGRAEAGALEALKAVNQTVDDGTIAWKRNQDAMGDTSGTDAATTAMSDYAEKAKASADATDRLRQAEQALAAAKGNLVAAQYASADAITAANKALEDHGQLTRDSAGNIDTGTAAYRAMDEALIGVIRSRTSEAEAMRDAQASQEELDKFVADANANLLQQALAWGLTEEEAAAYIERIGEVPEVVSTILKLEKGASEAEFEAFYKRIITSQPVLTVDGNTDPAIKQLMESLGYIANSEGVFEINAEDDPAMAILMGTLGEVDESTGVVTIDAKNIPARDKLRATEAEINRALAVMGISAQDRGAMSSAEAIRRSIDSMRATIKVGTLQAGTMTASGADGGIFHGVAQAFAQGGFSRLPGQATIQSPVGSAGLFQWAEPETEGEAFVPLAASKRDRSLQIMDEVAARFGYVMVARDQVRSYADGGVTAPAASSSVSAPAAPMLPESLVLRIGDREFAAFLVDEFGASGSAPDFVGVS